MRSKSTISRYISLKESRWFSHFFNFVYKHRIKSLTKHITEYFSNYVLSHLYNHIRCQKTFYIIFSDTYNHELWWGTGVGFASFVVLFVVCCCKWVNFPAMVIGVFSFWNAFFHMFLSLLYCILGNSFFFLVMPYA